MTVEHHRVYYCLRPGPNKLRRASGPERVPQNHSGPRLLLPTRRSAPAPVRSQLIDTYRIRTSRRSAVDALQHYHQLTRVGLVAGWLANWLGCWAHRLFLSCWLGRQERVDVSETLLCCAAEWILRLSPKPMVEVPNVRHSHPSSPIQFSPRIRTRSI